MILIFQILLIAQHGRILIYSLFRVAEWIFNGKRQLSPKNVLIFHFSLFGAVIVDLKIIIIMMLMSGGDDTDDNDDTTENSGDKD